MNRHRLIRRQGPRCGGPDRNRGGHAFVDLAALRHHAETAREIQPVDDLEPHENARRGDVLVLDLRFGQRRTAIQAPVHRLEALVHVAVLDDGGEGAQLLRLEPGIHGEIRVFPIAEHAEALEVLALRVDLLLGIRSAGGAERLGVDLLPHAPVGFLHLHLDGEAVAIPTGNVRRVVSVEGARLDDDVLQNLVDGVAQVNGAVRVRRSVGEHERGAPLGCRANLLVQPLSLPCSQHRGLAVGEIRLHGETRLRQVNRLFVVSHQSPSTKAREHSRRQSSFARSSNPRNRT